MALLLSYVGVSPATDVWFASLFVVISFTKLFMTGFINEIFLPRLVRSWELSPRYAEHLLSNIFTVFWVLSILGVLIIFIISPALVNIMYSNFTLGERLEIIMFMRSLSPVLALIIMNELLSMTLNSREIYSQPERARIFSSALNFLIILSLYTELSIWALFLATIVSHTVNLFFLIYALVVNDIKFGVEFRVSTWRSAKIISKLFSSGFYVLATQVYSLLFRSYLSSFPSGMITVFYYVENIIIKGRSLIMRPVSIVLLTDFSKSKKYQSGFDTWRQLTWYFMILGVFLFLLGLTVRFVGIFILFYLLDFEEYYQLIWFRSLLAFYILMIPLEIILVALRKRLVSLRFFNNYYLIAGFSQIVVAVMTLSFLNFGYSSLYLIYVIVMFDVVPKILAAIFILYKSNFVKFPAKLL